MDPGTLVAERYEIVSRAAAGGMGAVYRALDRKTGTEAAVKVVHPGAIDGSERLMLEANALAALAHVNVVRYLGHGATPDGEPFLAMEWVEGETLSRRLSREPLGTRASVHLARLVAEALAHAHAHGIVHRDVKPSNLILRDGDPERVMLVDFGVARAHQRGELTLTGMIVGTPAFMAPEQARGARELTPAADVFSLGCVLYRCLTGRNAFDGDDAVAILAKVLLDDPPLLSALMPSAPVRLEELLVRLLSKNPHDRPSDGREAAAAIAAIGPVEEGGPPIAVPKITLAERRLVSLVLAKTAIDPEATLVGDSTNDGLGPARAVAARHGARCELLASGALVVAISGRGTATDQAAEAATCALELRDALGGTVPLVLVTGRAVVDTGERSRSLGASRDAFDAAARLLSEAAREADAGRIVIDETSAGLLDHRFVLGPHPLGLELRGVREFGREPPRTLLGKATSCVGRDRELATLDALLAECASEPIARVAIVTAAPGLGKSRVRRELERRAAGRAETLYVTGDPLRARSPYASLGRLVVDAAGVRADDTPDSQARKLRGRIARHVARGEVEAAVELLGEVAGVSVGAPSDALRAARADPRLMRERIRSAVQTWLAAECGAKTVLVLLDDVQWCDPQSLEVVRDALRALEDAPLCVVAFGRPETTEVHPNLFADRAPVPLPLGPLSKKACERLVREALGEADDATVARIVLRAAGQPLLLEELIRAEVEGHEPSSATAIAMVQSRLETLDAEARQVLRAASVFGEVFWLGGVARLISGDPSIAIDGLEAREIVQRREISRYRAEPELVFRHALVRDAAYAMLTEEDAALGHRLAAAWLEERGEMDPGVLAEHVLRSDEPRGAVPHLVRAARLALDAGDFDGVRERAARARALGIDGTASGELFVVEAEAERWRGDTVQAETIATQALDLLAPGTVPWLSAARVVGFTAGVLGHTTLVHALGQQMLGIERDATNERAWLLTANQIASNLVHASDPSADALYAIADRITPEMLERDPALAMVHYHARSVAAAQRSQYERLLESAVAAVDAAVRANDRLSSTHYRTNVGFALGQLGDFEEALESLRLASDDARRMGLTLVELNLAQNIGHLCMCVGQLDEARAIEERVMADSVEKAPRIHVMAHACLARILVRQGEPARAAEIARRGVTLATTEQPRLYATASLAECELAAGAFERALEAGTQVATVVSARGVGHYVGDVLGSTVAVEALRALGREDDARAAIDLPLSLLRARTNSVSPRRRRAMLERVEDNRRALEVARLLGVPTGDISGI